mmetsp:Transcript_22637/g.57009  ORF Transcript_22637/g.57009 Transcript_22637/m.57009 type:complete len:260 (-) Transcript_22637:1964-2743(-)
MAETPRAAPGRSRPPTPAPAPRLRPHLAPHRRHAGPTAPAAAERTARRAAPWGHPAPWRRKSAGPHGLPDRWDAPRRRRAHRPRGSGGCCRRAPASGRRRPGSRCRRRWCRSESSQRSSHQRPAGTRSRLCPATLPCSPGQPCVQCSRSPGVGTPPAWRPAPGWSCRRPLPSALRSRAAPPGRRPVPTVRRAPCRALRAATAQAGSLRHLARSGTSGSATRARCPNGRPSAAWPHPGAAVGPERSWRAQPGWAQDCQAP